MSTSWGFQDNNQPNPGSVVGIGGLTGGNQGIYEESATAVFPLGTRRAFEDGRCFRYAHFTTATGAGLLVSPDVSVNSVAETDGSFTAAAIGATQVTASDATIGGAAADDYAGGYLHITDDAGEGHTYKIRSNTAGASNSVTLDLYDGLVVALTTDTDYAITGCLYDEVHAATTTDGLIAGVTMRAMTDEYFGWVQTWGIGTILSDTVITARSIVTLSDGVAGAVQPIAGGNTDVADLITDPIVGYATTTSDNTGYAGVMIQICP